MTGNLCAVEGPVSLFMGVRARAFILTIFKKMSMISRLV